jgi:hypothetical protein
VVGGGGGGGGGGGPGTTTCAGAGGFTGWRVAQAPTAASARISSA